MRTSEAKHYLPALLLTLGAVALGSCFSPDLGSGGFLCKEGVSDNCPEGYKCCGTVCRQTCTADAAPPLDKGAKEAGKDLSPDVGVDVGPDQASPPDASPDQLVTASCTDRWSFITSMTAGAGTIDLALDSNGVPLVGYISTAAQAFFRSKVGATGMSWNNTFKGPVGKYTALALAYGGGTMPIAVAAYQPTQSPEPLLHWFQPAPGSSAAPSIVGAGFAANDVAIANGSPTADVLFVIATGEKGPPAPAKRPAATLLGMLVSVGTSPALFHMCIKARGSNDTTAYRHPRVSQAKVKTKWTASASYYDEKSLNWGHAVADTVASDCLGVSYLEYPKGSKEAKSPVATALLPSGLSYLIHGVKLLSNLGELQWVTRSGQQPPSGPLGVISKDVDLTSSSVATSKGTMPCLTYVARVTGSAKLMGVYLTCLSGSNWTKPAVVDSFSEDPAASAYPFYLTRVAIGPLDAVHVLYQMKGGTSPALHYARCTLPK